jgi:hypothetical protein
MFFIKHAGLAQENGFGSVQFDSLRWPVNGSEMVCTCKKECDKYDMTAAQCF